MIPFMMLACLVQAPERLDVTAVGKDPRWQVAGRKTAVIDTNGKHALRLVEAAPVVGLVWLKDYDFGNGTIEVDLLGRSQPVQGSFVGVAFHVADAQTFCESARDAKTLDQSLVMMNSGAPSNW